MDQLSLLWSVRKGHEKGREEAFLPLFLWPSEEKNGKGGDVWEVTRGPLSKRGSVWREGRRKEGGKGCLPFLFFAIASLPPFVSPLPPPGSLSLFSLSLLPFSHANLPPRPLLRSPPPQSGGGERGGRRKGRKGRSPEERKNLLRPFLKGGEKRGGEEGNETFIFFVGRPSCECGK